MTTFSKILERVPLRVIEIPVHAWADDWQDKPGEPVRAGLRLLSESDIQVARASAADKAIAAHKDGEGRVESFNDHLMAWAVACALTDPNDSLRPYFESAHENVQAAFTTNGIRRIWEELEVLNLEYSPLVDEIEDVDVEDLTSLLADGRLSELDGAKQSRIRRLLTHVLAEITPDPTDA